MDEKKEMEVYVDNGDGDGFHEGTEADLYEMFDSSNQKKRKSSEEGLLDLKSTIVGGAVVGLVAGAIIGCKKGLKMINEKRSAKKLEDAYKLVEEDQRKRSEAEGFMNEPEPEFTMKIIENVENPPQDENTEE